MEIAAGVIWIALGIFVIVKKEAAGLGGPPLVGTVCAAILFVGVFICWKVIGITESVICFLSSIFLQLFLLFYALKNKDAAFAPLYVCGFILAPLSLFGETLYSLAKHSVNPWSAACYVAWLIYDLYYYSKRKEQKLAAEEKPQADIHPARYEQELPSGDRRVWINGKFADSGSHRSSSEGGDES